MDVSRYALLLAYDGTRFHGYARQRGRRTVQGTLEETLAMLLRESILTACAGRTDAGVHAAGQVASFDARAEIDLEWLQRRINRLLAPEVSIRAAVVAPGEFDARFSAKRRSYEYRIYGGPARDPFADRFALWEPRPLDAGAMHEASQVLVGEHDFSSFCRDNRRSLVRRIRLARVRSARDGRTTIAIAGDSFCHQMVRSITGCLIDVGLGKRPPSWMADVLEAKARQAAKVSIAPARGLTLMRVVYRPDPFGGDRTKGMPGAS